MARSGTRTRRSETTTGTRERIVEAAIATLKHEGYAGASARAIADRGGFSQGLVFYHFGSVRDLLLAALDVTSDRRMAAYRRSMTEVASLDELVEVARRIFREDLEDGHIKVLSEVIAACSVEPGLAEQVRARIDAWIDLTEETIEAVTVRTGIPAIAPARQLALAVVALYLGLELLTHLDGERDEAEGLFSAAASVATLVGQPGSG